MGEDPGIMFFLTGLSSWTGAVLARALCLQGRQGVGFCSRSLQSYSGLQAWRLRPLRQPPCLSAFRFWDQTPATAYATSSCWSAVRPQGGVWIHHHHWMQDFRSPDYLSDQAWKIGGEPLEALVPVLKVHGIQGVVVSGSFFEPGEGGVPEGTPRTPYACSKQRVWQHWVALAAHFELPLVKVVIPNPVGAGENQDRLSVVMLQKSLQGLPLDLKMPEAISDFLPVAALGPVYGKAIDALEQGRVLPGHPLVLRPSGYVTSWRDWVERLNQELLEKRLKWPRVPVHEGAPAVASVASLGYRNPGQEQCLVDWPSFWDEYAEQVKALQQERLLGGEAL